MARLPDKYRVPIVLCYLEGLTHEEAAERLGWPLGSVKGRLARARELLRSRLTRRGLALPAAGLAVQLGRDASAAVPPALVEATTKAALALVAGRAAAVGLISAPVADLIKGTLHAMTLSKLKLIAIPFVIAGSIATGAAVLADPAQDAQKRTAPTTAGSVADPSKRGALKVQREALDLRQAALSQIEMAREALRAFEADNVVPDAEKINQWSLRLMEAESEISSTPEDRLKAVEGHQERMKKWEKTEKDHVMDDGSRPPRFILLDWQYRRMQAERMLAEAKTPKADRPAAFEDPAAEPAPSSSSATVVAAAQPPASELAKAQRKTQTGQVKATAGRAPAGPGTGMAGGGGMGGMGGGGMGGMGGMGGGMMMGGIGGGMGRGGQALAMKRMENANRVEIAELAPRVEGVDKTFRTQQILKKLDEPVSMSFAHETPLEDVLKYIKSATQGPNDTGIPTYVDPVGLAEAEQTLTSPITMDLEGVPLKTTLRLILKQLGLAYCVKEGVLYISSVEGILQELQEYESTHPEIKKRETRNIQ